MSIGSADLHSGILTAWDTADLDSQHTQYWSAADIARYSPKYESGSVVPGTPFPRTVYEEGISSVIIRTSSGSGRTMREIPWIFRTYAENTATLSSKKVATDIAAAIMGVYGGHPTVTPAQICLDVGGVVRTQYQFDRITAVDEDIHMVTVMYMILIDTPAVY